LLVLLFCNSGELIRQSSEYLYDGPVDADTQLALAHGAGAPIDSEFMADAARRGH